MTSQGLANSLKKLSKKNGGKEYTHIESKEAAERLIGFLQLLIKVNKRNKWKEHVAKEVLNRK